MLLEIIFLYHWLIAKEFEKGDLIHVFGYFKENKKGDKVYKNFIVKSLNKIENKKENEEE